MVKTAVKRKKTITDAENVLKSLPIARLHDIAEIFSIPNWKHEKGKKSGHMFKVVGPKDIPAYGFIQEISSEMKIKDQLPLAQKYQLEPCDILISRESTKIGLVSNILKEMWIPSGHFFIIRFAEDKPDNAIALIVFLKSSVGRSILDCLLNGRNKSNLSYESISEMPVSKLTQDVKRSAQSIFIKEIEFLHTIEEEKKLLNELYRGYLKNRL